MKNKILFAFACIFVGVCFFAIIGKLLNSNYFINKLLVNERKEVLKENTSQTTFQNSPRIIKSKLLKPLSKNDNLKKEEKTLKNYIIPKDVTEVLKRKPKNNLPNFFDNCEAGVLAKQIVDAMTAEELLSQCLMFGWAGQDPNVKVANWVNGGLGSIKIFGWNTTNTKTLARSIQQLQTLALQSRFSIPLFVATDQEGGRVRHVKGLTSETPSALDRGASAIPRDSYLSGYFIGCELAEIGINLNFAPSVDLYNDYDSTIIASRSFGDNPKTVAQLAGAFSQGLKAAGILSTAKHFPGHGDTSLDSHGRLPKINITRQTFYERELIPFREIVTSGVSLVMSGHLNFPQFMPENLPATFSKDILIKLLRDELNFEGLIVTDDMMMLSALNYAGSFSRAVTLALQAGNNIVESSSTPSKNDKVWIENISLMKTDTSFFNNVKLSAEKIIFKKLQYFKNEPSVKILPEPETIHTKFPIKNSANFYQSFACRAVTIINNNYEKISSNDRVLVLSDYNNLLQIAKNFFPKSKTAKLSEAFLYTSSFDKIIFCIYDKYSQELFKNLQNTFPDKKYFVFSVMTPVFLTDIKAKTILAAYSYSDFSFIALCAALRGDFIPKGKITLENLYL